MCIRDRAEIVEPWSWWLNFNSRAAKLSLRRMKQSRRCCWMFKVEIAAVVALLRNDYENTDTHEASQLLSIIPKPCPYAVIAGIKVKKCCYFWRNSTISSSLFFVVLTDLYAFYNRSLIWKRNLPGCSLLKVHLRCLNNETCPVMHSLSGLSFSLGPYTPPYLMAVILHTNSVLYAMI